MLNNTEELNAMISLSGNAVSNIDVFVATFQSTKGLLINQACRNGILLQYRKVWEIQLKSVKVHIIKGIHLEARMLQRVDEYFQSRIKAGIDRDRIARDRINSIFRGSPSEVCSPEAWDSLSLY